MRNPPFIPAPAPWTSILSFEHLPTLLVLSIGVIVAASVVYRFKRWLALPLILVPIFLASSLIDWILSQAVFIGGVFGAVRVILMWLVLVMAVIAVAWMTVLLFFPRLRRRAELVLTRKLKRSPRRSVEAGSPPDSSQAVSRPDSAGKSPKRQSSRWYSDLSFGLNKPMEVFLLVMSLVMVVASVGVIQESEETNRTVEARVWQTFYDASSAYQGTKDWVGAWWSIVDRDLSVPALREWAACRYDVTLTSGEADRLLAHLDFPIGEYAPFSILSELRENTVIALIGNKQVSISLRYNGDGYVLYSPSGLEETGSDCRL